MCFTNLIGISRALNSTSESGYYLEDLDITLSQADASHSETDGSGLDFLERKRDFAYKIITDYIRIKLDKTFRAASAISEGVIGKYKNDLPTLAADATKYRGIRIRSDYAPYVKLNISRASLMLQSSGSKTIRVFDLIQNKEIDSFTITAVADEIASTDLLKSYQAHKQRLDLIFVYDASDAAYETYLSAGCKGCSGGDRFVTYSSIEIAQAAQKIQNNIDGGTGGTGGLSLTYNLECDLEAFVCSMREMFAAPALYLWASEVAKSVSQSDRFNSVVRLPNKNWEEKQEEWEIKFTELLDSRLENLKIPQDECFTCRGGINKRVLIP